MVYDVARLVRSAMPSVMTTISYSDCSKVTGARETERQQSRMLVNAFKNVGYVCDVMCPFRGHGVHTEFMVSILRP